MFVAGFGPSPSRGSEKERNDSPGKLEEAPNEKEKNAEPDSQIYFVSGQRLTRDEYLKLYPEHSTDNINLEQQISSLPDPSSSSSNIVLDNASKSITGQALKMGVPTAVGCAAAFVPVPVLQ